MNFLLIMGKKLINNDNHLHFALVCTITIFTQAICCIPSPFTFNFLTLLSQKATTQTQSIPETVSKHTNKPYILKVSWVGLTGQVPSHFLKICFFVFGTVSGMDLFFGYLL